MQSIFRKDVRFVNLDDFRKHQMRSRHMIQGTAQDVSSLVEESAHVNSASRYTLSNFLRKKDRNIASSLLNLMRSLPW